MVTSRILVTLLASTLIAGVSELRAR